MMLNCCKLRSYCNIPGTGTVKVLENLQRVIKKNREDYKKIQMGSDAKEEHSKGGENSPPSKWIQPNKQTD